MKKPNKYEEVIQFKVYKVTYFPKGKAIKTIVVVLPVTDMNNEPSYAEAIATIEDDHCPEQGPMSITFVGVSKNQWF